MLTEAQFREIADTLHCIAAELQDTVTELKKMNEPTVYNVDYNHNAVWAMQELNKYPREYHSGPSIA